MYRERISASALDAFAVPSITGLQHALRGKPEPQGQELFSLMGGILNMSESISSLEKMANKIEGPAVTVFVTRLSAPYPVDKLLSVYINCMEGRHGV